MAPPQKSALQNFWMAGEYDARREWNRQPLVRINGEGIRAFDAAHLDPDVGRRKSLPPHTRRPRGAKIMPAADFGKL